MDLKWIDKGRIQFELNSEGNIISDNDFGYIIYTEFPGTSNENRSVYDAYKIKFIKHSENLFSDKQLPVELQIFSLNKSGKELILSAMFEAFNDSNYGLEKLNVIGGMPGMTSALYAAQKDGQPNRFIVGGGQFVFNMNTLLGPTKNWLQYKGSSSSIPMQCKEATWLVLYELLPMSPGQIKHFRPPTAPMIAKNPKPGQFIYQNISKDSAGVRLPPPLKAGELSAMYPNLIVGVKTPVLTWTPTPAHKPLPKDSLTQTDISAGKNHSKAVKSKKPAKAKTVKLLAENIDLENEPNSMNRNLAEKNSLPEGFGPFKMLAQIEKATTFAGSDPRNRMLALARTSSGRRAAIMVDFEFYDPIALDISPGQVPLRAVFEWELSAVNTQRLEEEYNCNVCTKPNCLLPIPNVGQNKKYLTLFYYKTKNEFIHKDGRFAYVPWVVEVPSYQPELTAPTQALKIYANGQLTPINISRDSSHYWFENFTETFNGNKAKKAKPSPDWDVTGVQNVQAELRRQASAEANIRQAKQEAKNEKHRQKLAEAKDLQDKLEKLKSAEAKKALLLSQDQSMPNAGGYSVSTSIGENGEGDPVDHNNGSIKDEISLLEDKVLGLDRGLVQPEFFGFERDIDETLGLRENIRANDRDIDELLPQFPITNTMLGGMPRDAILPTQKIPENGKILRMAPPDSLVSHPEIKGKKYSLFYYAPTQLMAFGYYQAYIPVWILTTDEFCIEKNWKTYPEEIPIFLPTKKQAVMVKPTFLPATFSQILQNQQYIQEYPNHEKGNYLTQGEFQALVEPTQSCNSGDFSDDLTTEMDALRTALSGMTTNLVQMHRPKFLVGNASPDLITELSEQILDGDYGHEFTQKIQAPEGVPRSQVGTSPTEPMVGGMGSSGNGTLQSDHDNRNLAELSGTDSEMAHRESLVKSGNNNKEWYHEVFLAKATKKITDEMFVPSIKTSPEHKFWTTEVKLAQIMYTEWLTYLTTTNVFGIPAPPVPPTTQECVKWTVDVTLNVDDIRVDKRPTTVRFFKI